MARVVELTLDRGSVVRAAEAAIREARDLGVTVSTGDVRRLMRVARTAPEFAVGNWWIDGRCGCLVGNLLGRDGVRAGAAMGGAMHEVGLSFDTHLVHRLPAAEYRRYRRAGRLAKMVVKVS